MHRHPASAHAMRVSVTVLPSKHAILLKRSPIVPGYNQLITCR